METSHTPEQTLMFPPEPTDNANVSFVNYKGDYYVSTETNVMHKMDPETLETTKKVVAFKNVDL